MPDIEQWNAGPAYAAAMSGDRAGLLHEWRREWEHNGHPDHECATEAVMLPGGDACGVCGRDLNAS